jgi:hypothetical protein
VCKHHRAILPPEVPKKSAKKEIRQEHHRATALSCGNGVRAVRQIVYRPEENVLVATQATLQKGWRVCNAKVKSRTARFADYFPVRRFFIAAETETTGACKQ